MYFALLVGNIAIQDVLKRIVTSNGPRNDWDSPNHVKISESNGQTVQTIGDTERQKGGIRKMEVQCTENPGG